jgi:hypothetical protein
VPGLAAFLNNAGDRVLLPWFGPHRAAIGTIRNTANPRPDPLPRW